MYLYKCCTLQLLDIIFQLRHRFCFEEGISNQNFIIHIFALESVLETESAKRKVFLLNQMFNSIKILCSK